eukprot:1141041-Pelagomonas_calceolata.AAC.18
MSAHLCTPLSDFVLSFELARLLAPQVLYMFVQFWVDQMVAKYMGNGSTADWMRDTVPLADVPSEVRAATAGAADRAAATVASSVPDLFTVEARARVQAIMRVAGVSLALSAPSSFKGGALRVPYVCA